MTSTAGFEPSGIFDIIPGKTGIAYDGIVGNVLQNCGQHPAVTPGVVVAFKRSYNIAEVIGPSTCLLKPTPGTSTTYVWKLKTFPYPPQLAGIEAGGTIDQDKTGPYAFPFIRKGADGITTNGTNTITLSGTALAAIADFQPGRHLLINDDPTLAPSAQPSSSLRSPVSERHARPGRAGDALERQVGARRQRPGSGRQVASRRSSTAW